MNCQCNRRYVVVCASMAVAVLLLSTFDNLPALLTSVDDAFGYDDGGGDAWDDGTLAGEHAALFYPRKTMWFAGLNAREAFSNPYNVPTVRWTAAVEDAMQTVFDSVYHPAAERDCADPAVRFVVHQWIEYGITSEMRDLLSLTLVGLIDKRIVHLQPCDWGARCPRHYFDLLASSCDGAYDLENKEAYPEYSLKRLHEDTRIFYVPTDSLINFAGDKHDSLFSTPGDLWFWDSLFSTGGITYHDAATGQPIAYEEVITRYHPKVVRHLHLSLIRSLAFKVAFKLKPDLQRAVNKQVRAVRESTKTSLDPLSDQRMAVIHVRRSDKREDNNPYFTWLNDHVGFNSTRPITELVRYAESYLSDPFGSVMLLSDSVSILDGRRQIFTAFERGVRDLTLNLLGRFYSDHHGIDAERGHEAVPAELRKENIRQTLIEIYTAGRLGTYLLGSGSCGVSQYIAQLIALKYRMDASSIAIWEEDLWYVECQRLRGVAGDPIGSFVPQFPFSNETCAAAVRLLPSS